MERDHLEYLNVYGRTVIKIIMDPNKFYESWWDTSRWRACVGICKKVFLTPGNEGNVFNSSGNIVFSRRDPKP
jgi:hypothetical protein